MKSLPPSQVNKVDPSSRNQHWLIRYQYYCNAAGNGRYVNIRGVDRTRINRREEWKDVVGGLLYIMQPDNACDKVMMTKHVPSCNTWAVCFSWTNQAQDSDPDPDYLGTKFTSTRENHKSSALSLTTMSSNENPEDTPWDAKTSQTFQKYVPPSVQWQWSSTMKSSADFRVST